MSPAASLRHQFASLAVLLILLPLGGYLVSLPLTSFTITCLALLGLMIIAAVVMTASYAGATQSELSRLQTLLTERERALSLLNETVREEERIVDVLSSQNGSLKGELAAATLHRPIGEGPTPAGAS